MKPFTKLDDVEFGEFYHAAAGAILGLCSIKYLHPCSLSRSSGIDLGVCDPSGDKETIDKQELRRLIAQKYCQASISVRFESACEQLQAKPELMKLVDSYFTSVATGFEPKDKIAFCWIRQNNKNPERSTTQKVFYELCERCRNTSRKIVVCGSRPSWLALKDDMRDATFLSMNDKAGRKLNHLEQLLIFDKIKSNRNCVSIGLQSGAMDGLAYFLRIPTKFISDEKTCNNGMRELSKSIAPFTWLELKYEKCISSLATIFNQIDECLK